MRIFVVAACCAALGGCASIARGTTENIAIDSTPGGARADVVGTDVPTSCTTPCIVQVKRSADVVITFSKEGYENQILPLTKDIAGAGAAGFAGNLLLGGVVGMAVDGYNGSANDHKPNPATVVLQSVQRAPAPVIVPSRPSRRSAPVS